MFSVETSRELISRRTGIVASIAVRIVIVLAISLALVSSGSVWPGKGVNLLPTAVAASDTTRPTVTIDQPSTGSTLAAGTIMVKGKASDNSGGSGINRVEVKVDSGPYKIATPAAAGDWSS